MQAGNRVLLHGFGRGIGSLDAARDAMGISRCLSIAEAEACLARNRMPFLPLSAIHPQLQALASLYRHFEMRSPILHIELAAIRLWVRVHEATPWTTSSSSPA